MYSRMLPAEAGEVTGSPQTKRCKPNETDLSFLQVKNKDGHNGLFVDLGKKNHKCLCAFIESLFPGCIIRVGISKNQVFIQKTEISAFTSPQKWERTWPSLWQTTTSSQPRPRRGSLQRKAHSWLRWSVTWGTLRRMPQSSVGSTEDEPSLLSCRVTAFSRMWSVSQGREFLRGKAQKQRSPNPRGLTTNQTQFQVSWDQAPSLTVVYHHLIILLSACNWCLCVALAESLSGCQSSPHQEVDTFVLRVVKKDGIQGSELQKETFKSQT